MQTSASTRRKLLGELSTLVVAICFCNGTALAQELTRPPDDDMLWLSNSEVKVGLKKSSGGAIAWISSASSQKNLINAYDRGRLVQQSWYGKKDDSLWNNQPWSWNPVQGGDWRGRSAKILEERHDQTSSFMRTRPVHWATGADVDECEMRQTITLKETLIHSRYDFAFHGMDTHPGRHQELPAFFVDASLDTLILYEGDAAWSDGPITRRQPGFPNEYARISEHWAAYVAQNDIGIGLFVPKADEATFYRFPAQKDRSHKLSEASWCSYVAPIRTLAVTPMFEFTYDVWITLGSATEIRERFKKIAAEQ